MATVQTGYVREVFSFVRAFSPELAENVLEASASSTERSGGVQKPAIFEHPTPSGDASITYSVRLPQVREGEVLALAFDVGLRDGVVFDDPAAPFNGVLFALELNGRSGSPDGPLTWST